MTLLSVNLNKVALLRNSRDTVIPSVIDAAKTCIDCGARGITVHQGPIRGTFGSRMFML